MPQVWPSKGKKTKKKKKKKKITEVFKEHYRRGQTVIQENFPENERKKKKKKELKLVTEGSSHTIKNSVQKDNIKFFKGNALFMPEKNRVMSFKYIRKY